MEDNYGPGAVGPGGTDNEVAQVFRELTGTFMVPQPNECLICFLMRGMSLLKQSGFEMTAIYQKFNAPRATQLHRRLLGMGVYGDCHLLQRGVTFNAAVWGPDCCPDCGLPYAVPDCLEVRHGSTQPCKLWRWRRDVERERFNALWDRRY